MFAGEVPQGDVERADTDLSDVFGPGTHVAVVALALQRGLANQCMGEGLGRRLDDFGSAAPRHVLTDHACIGIDPQTEPHVFAGTAR